MINLSLLSLLLVLSSCGVAVRTTKDLDVNVVDISEGTPSPLMQEKIPKNCNFTKAFKTNIYYDYKHRAQKLSHLNSIIDSVYLGGEKEVFKSTIGFRYRSPLSIMGRMFKACGGHDYTKNKSYQSAAASALYSFSEIEKIKHLLPASISPVRLRVATTVRNIYETSEDGVLVREEKQLINNAFYNSKDKEIIFVPQGTPDYGFVPFSGIPMWEIPFVSAHEYGHHVFSHFMTNYLNDKLIKHKPRVCFDDHFEGGDQDRNVKFQDIMKSLNEGVADLFSRIVIDKKITMEGLTCLEDSRDVTSDTFANGESKILNKQSLSEFFSTRKIGQTDCLKSVNYQDPHTVGAVFANAFYKVLKEGKLDQKQMLSFLYEYLKDINSKYFQLKNLSLDKSLEDLFLMGFSKAEKAVGLSQREKCGIISQSYPSLHSYYSCKK
jgi:hypothetical protein